MELRDTWSFAPTPSIDKTVASGSMSVANLTACPTQSTPARVDNANWNGAHASLTAVPNCLANVLATNRLKDDPVAMPRTPPSFFRSAVIVSNMKDWAAGGVSALAKSSAAEVNNERSSSSKQTLHISLVHPPGPGALPDGAVCKHFANVFASNCNGDSGMWSMMA